MSNILDRRHVRGSMLAVDNLYGTAFTGEENAHVFRITDYEGGAAVAFTGEIAGKFINPAGVTVPLSGSLDEDGRALVTLDEHCYAVAGRFILTIWAGSEVIYCGVGQVMNSQTDTIDYPTAGIPDVAALIQQLQTILNNWPADYSQLQSDVSNLKSDLDELGTDWTNIAYANASMINTEYTAASANETYNGSQVPYTFTSGEYWLVIYKLSITGYLKSTAGLIRPTLIGYDGGFRRLDYTANTPHSWLDPSTYTLGDDIILWDVVKSVYTSNKYLIALHCPSGTSPFNNSTTKLTYKSMAIVAVDSLEEGAALAYKMLPNFSFKSHYYFPFVTESMINDIVNARNTLTGFNVFSRFCVVGDSLSCGFYTDSENTQHFSDYAHSWPYYIEKIFGAKAYWAGYSGQTCQTWLAQTSGTWGKTYTQNLGAMPLYFLCMGANEYGTTIGTIADITSDSPTTLYGYVGKTIRTLRDISPNCYIICVGVSRQQTTASVVNEVYEATCAQFTKCYYFDVQAILNTTPFTECFYSSHYSALGYERMARLYNWVVDEVINAHASDFLYINETDITTQPK